MTKVGATKGISGCILLLNYIEYIVEEKVPPVP